MAKNPLEIDMIAGSQLRDTQGETLSIEGADISDLENGKGRFNDNHGKGFFNSIGRVSSAKKIFGEQDCETDRHKYYWDKVKTPFIYVKGVLFDDEDHPNARAAAAILRNIHKSDVPLKIKASVEGGVVARGIKDNTFLAKTKIHSVALTFTPANTATLVEPISLDKSVNLPEDMHIIASVVHLAESNVPSFRHITRDAQASKVHKNLELIAEILSKNLPISVPSKKDILESTISKKIESNVVKINAIVKDAVENSNKESTTLNKALTASYGGASAPCVLTGGAVLQGQVLEKQPKIKHVVCDNCGKEQVYSKFQVKCRPCGASFSLQKLSEILE